MSNTAKINNHDQSGIISVWLANSLRRFYLASPAEEYKPLLLEAARGERCSFQVVIRTGERPLTVCAEAHAIGDLPVEVRLAGYVPIRHLTMETPLDDIEGAGFLPGYAPDPLLPVSLVQAGAHETHSFWITVQVGTEVTPGRHTIMVIIRSGKLTPLSCEVTVLVHRAILPPRRNFPVTQWFYADALCDWYKVELFEEPFWKILKRYLSDLSLHGQDTVYVPAFTPSLDGVKRPTQLLDVQIEQGEYRFDWSMVAAWVKMARECGLSRFEWPHLFTQWGADRAIRIYEGRAENGNLLWPPETGALSETYRRFLARYLSELERFLHLEKLTDCSFFHLSDEPHEDSHFINYRAARGMLRELAPWMKITDALSELKFAYEGLVDIPVPGVQHAPDFVEKDFFAWAYFCCGPRGRYLNRFLDTPLLKLRMAGWLFFKLQARGFLHWGYNYWYRFQTTELIDPYAVTDGLAWPKIPPGDTFVVYPGTDGPVDSLRWEVFAESLQDYTLLQAAASDPNAPMLAGIHDYADFPRDVGWIAARRSKLLAELDKINMK